MKLKKFTLLILFTIAPIYGEPPLSELTPRIIRRKTSIRDVAQEIIHIEQQIDQLTNLRSGIKNPREINRILQAMDILKTTRDLKLRELNTLRQ